MNKDASIRLAVVPVAGLGTRMLPLTKSIPKEMLPVGRKLCIEHIVDELCACGIEEIVFIISEGKEKIPRHFEQDPVLDQRLRNVGKDAIADQLADLAIANRIRITMVSQPTQQGLGHAILCAKEAVDGRNFVIALGDSMIQTRSGSPILNRMCESFAANQPGIMIAFQQVPLENVVKYGIAKPSGEAGSLQPGSEFELVDLVEKPSVDEAPSRFAISARYILSAEIFGELEQTEKGTGGEIQLTDAMSSLISKGTRAMGVCLSENEKRIDIGSIAGYLQAFIETSLNDPEYGDGLREYLRQSLEAVKV